MSEKEKNIAEEVETEAKTETKADAKKEKSAKAKKEKKPGKVKNAWKGFRSEFKKIVWPTWKQVLKNSGIVIVIVLVCALMIGALDLAFNQGFKALVDLFTK